MPVLDHLSREQLVGLLYEILRRLLAPVQTTCTNEVPRHEGSKQDGQLIVDPTIDAWEHTGIYPQGYTPPQIQTPHRSEDTQASMAPQFGRPSVNPLALPASTAAGGLLVGVPCTAFCRPWQPGYPEPSRVPASTVPGIARQFDDQVAQVPSTENVPRTPVLPLGTPLSWQNRSICSSFCRCSNPCIVTRVGHAFHFCRSCIDLDHVRCFWVPSSE